MSREKLALGLMSGTSADGLTVCLFNVAAKKVKYFKTYPYPAALQKEILAAKNLKTPQLSELNFKLGMLYAQKVKLFFKQFKIDARRVSVIGSHGQTVWHAPEAKTPNTLQIGEGVFLAQQFNIPVVYNFRPRDIAAGGTGAPLTPAFDDFLNAGKEPKIFLNIGGIANISVSGRGVETFGFDLGPGNVMIDSAVNALTKGRLTYDKGGNLARAYEPDIKKAQALLKLFIKEKPPLSLERSAYGITFLQKHFKQINERDIATLTFLSALIIATSLKKFVLSKYKITTVEVSGGGLFNKTLLKYLAQNLPGVKVTPSRAIEPMAKEAAAFAYFAWRTLRGEASGCNKATGARQSVILGSLLL